MNAHTPASRMSGCAGTRVSAVVIAHSPCPDRGAPSSPKAQKRTKPLTLSDRPVNLEAVTRTPNASKSKSIIAFVAPFTHR
jgi:hypothetical protein